MLIALAAVLGLAPGLATAWLLRGRGWHPAAVALAGACVTVLTVVGLLVSLAVLAPLAIFATTGCVLAALRAYDRGRLLTATGWMSLAAVCMWCAGWAL